MTRPTLPTLEGIPPVRFRASWVAFALVALALAGLGLALVDRPTVRESIAPAVTGTGAAPIPRGDLPIIGDPIRDLTVWYSNRVSDANRASLDNLKGHFLSPLDPLADASTRDLYGKMLVIAIPLLTFGGLALGYLIMVSRTTGESAYTARSVTPRFVAGATLSILGIFLVSVLAQFVTAIDMAMVGVSIPGNAVGGPDAWPASGGVFQVLQNGGFDPHISEGPDNWNDGAWLSAGLLAAILLTFVQMINGMLSVLESLLVIIGPLCLAAYALTTLGQFPPSFCDRSDIGRRHCARGGVGEGFVRALSQFAAGIRSAFSLVLLLVAAAAIVVVRTSSSAASGANPAAPAEVQSTAANSLESALAPGGSGISFETAQRTTLYAKPDGPKIELHTPDDPQTVTGVVDEYTVGTILSRGGATADAFWMEISVAGQDQSADFLGAAFFARVLDRDGKLWRDDGAGWYITDESPGVGMDPASARALSGVLRSLADAKTLEPSTFDGQLLTGIRGTSTPASYPGVIAADGAGFTEKSFAIDCWFDEQGRLVRLEAHARNLNQETYDLTAVTVVTLSYGVPGDPPDPNPTMAPEALPTSEPVAAEVKA